MTNDLGLKENLTRTDIPALSSLILQPLYDDKDFNETWSYRSLIGKLNYLEKSTRPDIVYAVHQCARFASQPKSGHAIAIKNIGRYLLSTKDKGIICMPNNNAIEFYADAAFAGNWNEEIAGMDKATSRSRTGFVIKYAGMMLTWGSQLQKETALSATEAEYIALSTALRQAIPIIDYSNELREHGFKFNNNKNEIFCKAFEDNEGALEMARSPKFRPRTKHFNIKYHHFHDSIEDGKIKMAKIGTLDQQADIFTEPLRVELFEKLRKLLMGW
jgi:hypothetical protein